MPPATFWQVLRDRRFMTGTLKRRFLAGLLDVGLLVILISIEIIPLLGHSAFAQITSINHTNPGVDDTCRHMSFSADGNPFALCPGPLPSGGNCVWWAWEQWHLLGYDLPRNWGNAADWISDAERSGLPMGGAPRVGSIAVFPVGDGVWAFTSVGHVAFVTAVSPDGSTFNVTYQNYGDATPMYIGQNYPVSIINKPRYQNGNMRFIYFPRLIDPRRFAQLPGVVSVNLSEVDQANQQFGRFDGGGGGGGGSGNTPPSTATNNQVALGLPPTSTDQEFNADFTGIGYSDLLLYNRTRGTLKILSFTDQLLRLRKLHLPRFIINEILANQVDTTTPQLVSLGDKLTPANSWGSTLDIHVGDFTGAGKSEILLYDRVSGKLQLISLTARLKIEKHLIFQGYGPGWELYVGAIDGLHSGVFMYNRLVNALPIQSSTPTPTPTLPAGITPPAGGSTPRPRPTASVTATPSCGTATPTPTVTVDPKAIATPGQPPCPTPTPVNVCPTPTAKACPSPTPGKSKAETEQNMLLQFQKLTQGAPLDNDLSSKLSAMIPQVLAANAMALDFDHHFNILYVRQYTLLDNAWEVYVGRFVSAKQDGLLLYDRVLGEVRLLSFNAQLNRAHYQSISNVDPNWEVFSGDFVGSGRSQVLLYNPGSGDSQFLNVKSDLSLASKQTFSGWATNQALYVGHFGAPTLSVMLYNPQAIQSTFMEFDRTLSVLHQVSVQSWSNHWQVLIGSFLDRSRCLAEHNCLTGDDILVLNRQTGQFEQFVFSFGNQYTVSDPRSQSFERANATAGASLSSVDTSTFSLLTTLQTSIRGEELY